MMISVKLIWQLKALRPLQWGAMAKILLLYELARSLYESARLLHNIDTVCYYAFMIEYSNAECKFQDD